MYIRLARNYKMKQNQALMSVRKHGFWYIFDGNVHFKLLFWGGICQYLISVKYVYPMTGQFNGLIVGGVEGGRHGTLLSSC